MTSLAITLVHNKTDAENEAQITALKALLTEVTDGPFTNEETGETWTTTHHEIIGLTIPHTVKVYQVIPFGVIPPANRGEINSGGMVYYGLGDEDKIGNHPRFFNWGLKRGTDYGADISLYLEDVSKFDITKLSTKFEKLIDKNDPMEFDEDVCGKLATVNLLKEKGQLDETKTIEFELYKGGLE